MKHTKWKISLGRLVDENMERILVPNDFLLPTDNDNKEAIANAKLIASAPEMLEALTHLVSNARILKAVADSGENSLLSDRFNEAIRVIKQATE